MSRPATGPIREVREELGLDLAVGRLLVADWLPPYLGWEDALELIFDGGLVTRGRPGLVLPAGERDRLGVLLTLEQAAAVVTPLSHRRLSVAVGQADGETAYLQDGRRVGQDRTPVTSDERPLVILQPAPQRPERIFTPAAREDLDKLLPRGGPVR